jgi:hypothetical protein
MIYPLVLNQMVGDAWMYRVLIDGGSSLNILFVKTYSKMGL